MAEQTVEQVWVQTRGIGLMVEAERGRAVLVDIMTRTHSLVGSIHDAGCKLAAAPQNVCSCTPILIRAAEAG